MSEIRRDNKGRKLATGRARIKMEDTVINIMIHLERENQYIVGD